jgi:hypothetical protein
MPVFTVRLEAPDKSGPLKGQFRETTLKAKNADEARELVEALERKQDDPYEVVSVTENKR